MKKEQKCIMDNSYYILNTTWKIHVNIKVLNTTTTHCFVVATINTVEKRKMCVVNPGGYCVCVCLSVNVKMGVSVSDNYYRNNISDI